MATRKQVEQALELFEEELAARPDVVGLGIVPEFESKAKSKAARGLAVGVYVRQAKAREAVPKALEVLSRGRAVKVPIRVIEQGEVQLESPGRESL